MVCFENVSFSYDGKRAAVADVSFRCSPARRWRSSARPARASRPRSACCIVRSIRRAARILDRRHDIREVSLASLAEISASSSRSRCCSHARSRRICASVGLTPSQADIAECDRACTGRRIHRPHARGPRYDRGRARPIALRRRAPAPVHRPRAAQGPADPDPRRGDLGSRRRHGGQAAAGARRR